MLPLSVQKVHSLVLVCLARTMLLAYVYAKKKGINTINGSIEDIAVYVWNVPVL